MSKKLLKETNYLVINVSNIKTLVGFYLDSTYTKRK